MICETVSGLVVDFCICWGLGGAGLLPCSLWWCCLSTLFVRGASVPTQCFCRSMLLSPLSIWVVLFFPRPALEWGYLLPPPLGGGAIPFGLL